MSNKSFFTEKFPLNKLKLYERNPRKISQKAIDAVAKSIRMNGALDPIETDEDGLILAGHTRYKAYKSLGYTEVPVIQHIGLTAIQKRTYRIASNKTAEYSEWDDELLAAELKDIEREIDRVMAQDGTGISESIKESEVEDVDILGEIKEEQPYIIIKFESFEEYKIYNKKKVYTLNEFKSIQ